MVERNAQTENFLEQRKAVRGVIENLYGSEWMKEELHSRWLNNGGGLTSFVVENPDSNFSFIFRSPRHNIAGTQYWFTRETKIDGSPFNIYQEDVKSNFEGDLEVEGRYLSGKPKVVFSEQETIDKAREIVSSFILDFGEKLPTTSESLD